MSTTPLLLTHFFFNIIYCLLHYNGNTTSFIFLWLFYITRFNNLTVFISTILQALYSFWFYIAWCNNLTVFIATILQTLHSFWFYIAWFNNLTVFIATILQTLHSFWLLYMVRFNIFLQISLQFFWKLNIPLVVIFSKV